MVLSHRSIDGSYGLAVLLLVASLLLSAVRPALGQEEIRDRIRESQQRLEQIRRERQQLTNEASQLRG
ncbi:MAG: hypothetical protein M8862_11355, partial [marine benthic group bacterium]|nr:hypothetical protein [Gemmatimonadota bacterium]